MILKFINNMFKKRTSKDTKDVSFSATEARKVTHELLRIKVFDRIKVAVRRGDYSVLVYSDTIAVDNPILEELAELGYKVKKHSLGYKIDWDYND